METMTIVSNFFTFLCKKLYLVVSFVFWLPSSETVGSVTRRFPRAAHVGRKVVACRSHEIVLAECENY